MWLALNSAQPDLWVCEQHPPPKFEQKALNFICEVFFPACPQLLWVSLNGIGQNCVAIDNNVFFPSATLLSSMVASARRHRSGPNVYLNSKQHINIHFTPLFIASCMVFFPLFFFFTRWWSVREWAGKDNLVCVNFVDSFAEEHRTRMLNERRTKPLKDCTSLPQNALNGFLFTSRLEMSEMEVRYIA